MEDFPIYWSYIAGPSDLVISSLRRTVGALRRHGNFHQKIGITNNPERRWKEYYAKDGWGDMRVIYTSTYWQDCKDLEKKLIKQFELSQARGIYWNLHSGGNGRPPIDPPFWLYVVNGRKYSRITH